MPANPTGSSGAVEALEVAGRLTAVQRQQFADAYVGRGGWRLPCSPGGALSLTGCLYPRSSRLTPFGHAVRDYLERNPYA